MFELVLDIIIIKARSGLNYYFVALHYIAFVFEMMNLLLQIKMHLIKNDF